MSPTIPLTVSAFCFLLAVASFHISRLHREIARLNGLVGRMLHAGVSDKALAEADAHLRTSRKRTEKP